MRISIGFILAQGALLAPAALADRRDFVRAYEVATQPKGNLEFELWNDVISPDPGGLDLASTAQKLELEYGITDHWDVALYHAFEQDHGDAFHFDSWRLETRYRILEKGELPVDVMLYLEIERPAALEEPFETEEKIILERDFGPLALVANLVGEQKFLHANEGTMFELDLGASYEITPALHVGLEYWTLQQKANGITQSSNFAGPSISVASDRLWLQVGAGFGSGPTGLGDAPASAQIRSVLGFNL